MRDSAVSTRSRRRPTATIATRRSPDQDGRADRHQLAEPQDRPVAHAARSRATAAPGSGPARSCRGSRRRRRRASRSASIGAGAERERPVDRAAVTGTWSRSRTQKRPPGVGCRAYRPRPGRATAPAAAVQPCAVLVLSTRRWVRDHVQPAERLAAAPSPSPVGPHRQAHLEPALPLRVGVAREHEVDLGRAVLGVQCCRVIAVAVPRRPLPHDGAAPGAWRPARERAFVRQARVRGLVRVLGGPTVGLRRAAVAAPPEAGAVSLRAVAAAAPGRERARFTRRGRQRRAERSSAAEAPRGHSS